MTHVTAVSRVTLRAPDVAQATADYACLLGKKPKQLENGKRAWFALSNAVLEIVGGQPQAGSIAQLTFHAPGVDSSDTQLGSTSLESSEDGPHQISKLASSNARGLPLAVESELAAQRIGDVDISPHSDQVSAVDHIVVNTHDGDDIVRLFRDDLGIRLALDQTVKEWGGRMLFFRTGKFTIEVIDRQKDSDGEATDAFWGIALQTPDLRATHARLTEAGVTISEIRKGRKPGTIVATPKSHTLDIPTLLIGPDDEA